MMGKDKILHATVCCIVALFVALPLALFVDLWCAIIVGIVASMLLGVGKEYGDKNASGNHWCWWDLLADFVGSSVGAVVAIVVIILIK